jgi:beta-phosphoglucomutase-like phosphatase (HAD superfamily)
MIRALILDYNGVIVNDEPIHLEAFRSVAAEAGFALTREEYFTRYLGVSDREIALDLIRRAPMSAPAGQAASHLEEMADHLLARKAMDYRRRVRVDLPEVPGATSFIQEASRRYPIAVASGALRVEVEDGLERLGVRDAVTAVIAIEDVRRGKPDPETFLSAREALIRICSTPGAPLALAPSEPTASFLVIEDSPPGLAAARAAWMRAAALLTSRPASDMKPADLVVRDLSELSVEMIAAL